MSCWLTSDAQERLREIESSTPPAHAWRSGCYGAALAWIVLVGPSPGGREEDPTSRRGWAHTLHNQLFLDPLTWKMRNSIKPLLGSVTGLPFDKSGKLYAIANFDFRQQPKASKVPEVAMRRGVSRVIHLLVTAKPRVICAMDRRSWGQLIEALERKRLRIATENLDVDIPIPRAENKHHRRLEIAYLKDWPESDSYLVRLPQHPSHIYIPEYARRMGKTIHKILSTRRRLGG